MKKENQLTTWIQNINILKHKKIVIRKKLKNNKYKIKLEHLCSSFYIHSTLVY